MKAAVVDDILRNIVAAGGLLVLFAVTQTLAALYGEVTLYQSLALGIFLAAAVMGHGPRKNAPVPFFPALLSVLGGTAVIAIFSAVAWSLRIRTANLAELYRQLGEAVDVWDVVKRGDALVGMAFASSTLPAFFVAFAALAALGWLTGSVVFGRRGESRSTRGMVAAALGAALVHGFLLAPRVDLFHQGPIAGLLLSLAAVGLAWGGRTSEKKPFAAAVAAVVVNLGLLLGASRLDACFDRHAFYEGPDTAFAERFVTPWQRVAMVTNGNGAETSVYLDRHLQFTGATDGKSGMTGLDNQTAVLVHGALALHRNPERVLVLGSAGGTVAREVLKHGRVKRLTNVDADWWWMNFSASDHKMRALNGAAFDDPRVARVPRDSIDFAREAPAASFDVILKDFPPGSGEDLARSVSVEFFRSAKRLLKPDGILSVHSDYYGTPSFWTVARTLRAAGFEHLAAVNDNFSAPDAFEGILYASTAPYALERLLEDPHGKYLVDNGVLPPLEGLRHDSDPEFIDYQIDLAGATVNRLAHLSYLPRFRQENGFLLPLVFQIGVY